MSRRFHSRNCLLGKALPDDGTRFGAILADPPFAFRAYSEKGEGRSPQHHYRCPSFAELCALPVMDIAVDDCFLFLWVPLRSIDLIGPLMYAWGFLFSGSAFVWIKQNKSGAGWFMGNGFGTRHNAEVCWLGRRGKPKRRSKAVRELIVAPRREHSRKPEKFYQRVQAYSDGPYLEMFARQSRDGFDGWGRESTKFDQSQPQEVLS